MKTLDERIEELYARYCDKMVIDESADFAMSIAYGCLMKQRPALLAVVAAARRVADAQYTDEGISELCDALAALDKVNAG